MSEDSTVKITLSPVLRDALASRQPGEDLDEALLRALKALHPERAPSLLSAVNRVVDMEARRANESREQTVERLAASDPGPEIVLRTHQGPPAGAVGRSTVIRAGGREYHSPDELPPDLRRAFDAATSGRPSRRRVGCSLSLVSIVARLLGK